MSAREISPLWPAGLWTALLSGIAVAWSPRYWAVSVAISGISIVAVLWTIFSWRKTGNLESLRRSNWSRQTALVACIGGWGFLQLAFHTTVLPQLTLDNSIIWTLSAAVFLLGSQILCGRAARKLFLEMLMWSLAALAVIAMLQFHGASVQVFGIFPAAETVVGTLLSGNQFAALMEIAAPVALWYMIEQNLLAGGLCYAMILAAAITAGSRAGVILLVTETIVFICFVLFARRREAKAIGSILAGLTLLLAVAAIIAGTDQIKARFESKNPYSVRQELLNSTLTLITQRPVSGYGMGTWRAVYPRAATFDLALLANEAHNDWAQWASDGGVPFALLMAGLVLWIAKPAVQSIWGLGILSVMLHSYFDYPIREPALSFLWFALAGAVSQFRVQDPR